MNDGTGPRILVVKLSSLGDVVHGMPAVQDMRAALPGARIDWVVEGAFAPLVRRCEGVGLVIECELRRWRRSPLAAATRAQWREFRARLQGQAYDAVVDLQGLTKSALVARLARLAPGGLRHALANRTDGSSWEAPTRWVADRAHFITPHVHAVQRGRVLCALALGYEPPAQPAHFGLRASAGVTPQQPTVALVHGASRADKLWPVQHWVELGRRLAGAGLRTVLPHASAAEHERALQIAAGINGATMDVTNTDAENAAFASVWPAMALGELADHMAACAGVIGVDSGLSHIAVALDLPHVQIYNFDTAWRTGPQDTPHQRAVHAPGGPTLDAVWQTWCAVHACARHARS